MCLDAFCKQCMLNDDANVHIEIGICADAGAEIPRRPRACSFGSATQTEHHMVASDDKNLEVSGNELQERASVVHETWLSAAAFSQQLRGCIGCLGLSYSS